MTNYTIMCYHYFVFCFCGKSLSYSNLQICYWL